MHPPVLELELNCISHHTLHVLHQLQQLFSQFQFTKALWYHSYSLSYSIMVEVTCCHATFALISHFLAISCPNCTIGSECHKWSFGQNKSELGYFNRPSSFSVEYPTRKITSVRSAVGGLKYQSDKTVDHSIYGNGQETTSHQFRHHSILILFAREHLPWRMNVVPLVWPATHVLSMENTFQTHCSMDTRSLIPAWAWT